MIITPTFTDNFHSLFDADVEAAMAVWSAAAQLFSTAFSDDIHVNITVDAVSDANVLGESFPRFVDIGYEELFQRLSDGASTQTDLIAVGPGGSITPTDPTGGTGKWQLTRAQAKALGKIADDNANDGSTTFGVSSNTPYTFTGPIALNAFDFLGVAAHEISEIMGRFGVPGNSNKFSLLDAFAFSDVGVRTLHGGAGSFFSIDGGQTLLKQFNDTTFKPGDSRDWNGETIDAFNAQSTRTKVLPVTPIDMQVMDAIGYGTANPAGSLIQVAGHISFLRAHDPGTGYGKGPNYLDGEVIVKLVEDPLRAFGFQLRNDENRADRRAMFDLLRAALVTGRRVRIDYITIGPLAGEIIRVANA